MKRYFYTLATVLIAVVSLSFSGCIKDENGGVENEAMKILGSWLCERDNLKEYLVFDADGRLTRTDVYSDDRIVTKKSNWYLSPGWFTEEDSKNNKEILLYDSSDNSTRVLPVKKLTNKELVLEVSSCVEWEYVKVPSSDVEKYTAEGTENLE